MNLIYTLRLRPSTLICVALLSVALFSQPFDDIVYSRGTFFGNANNDSYLLHMAVDAQGNVYGTGMCTSIPATAGAYKTTNQGAYDIMVFKLDPTMSKVIWATYIGGSNNEAGGNCIARLGINGWIRLAVTRPFTNNFFHRNGK